MLHFEIHSVYKLYAILSGGFNRLDIFVKLKQKTSRNNTTIRNKLWNWNHLCSIPNEGWFLFQYMFMPYTFYVHFHNVKPETPDSFSFAESRARPCTWLCRARIRPVSPSTWERCSKSITDCNDLHQYSYLCYLLYSHYRVMQSIQLYKSNETVTVCYTYFFRYYGTLVLWKMLWNQLYENCTHALTTIWTWICRWYLSSAWSTLLIYGVILYHTVPDWKPRKKESMQYQTMPNRASCLDILIRCDGKCFYKCASPELWCPIHQSTSAKHDLDISHHLNQAAVKHKTCRLSQQLWIVVRAVIWFARKVHIA